MKAHTDGTAPKKNKKADQYKEDFKWLMSTERGRRLMWSWLADSHVFSTSVQGNSATLTYYNEGERNIGLKRMADINLFCPEFYLKMVQEAQENLES